MTFDEAVKAGNDPPVELDWWKKDNCIPWEEVDLSRWDDLPEWAYVLSPHGIPVQKSGIVREAIEQWQRPQ